jgi:hypothetical protein
MEGDTQLAAHQQKRARQHTCPVDIGEEVTAVQGLEVINNMRPPIISPFHRLQRQESEGEEEEEEEEEAMRTKRDSWERTRLRSYLSSQDEISKTCSSSERRLRRRLSQRRVEGEGEGGRDGDDDDWCYGCFWRAE